MILLLLWQLLPPIFVPATIDNLGYLNETYVVIEGIGGGIERDDNIVSFRLLDEHGHYRKCVLPQGMDPAKPGAHVRVKGTRKFFHVNGAAEINPVYSITPIEDP